MRKPALKYVVDILDQNYTVALMGYPYEIKYLKNLVNNDTR